MAEAGFVSIFLGIENGSIKSLKAMQKPNTLESIRRGVRELQQQRLIVVAGIINADDYITGEVELRFLPRALAEIAAGKRWLKTAVRTS